MSLPEKKLYAKILVAGFINSELPDEMYATKDYVRNKVEGIDKMSSAELDQ